MNGDGMHIDDSINFELFLSVLDETDTVRIPVNGRSMRPFLKEGRDKVVLTKADTDLVKKGDIVVYKKGGSFLLHRVVSIDGGAFCIMGDNELSPDCGISPQAVVASVKSVERNGKVIDKKHPLWRFYKIIFVNPSVRRVFHSFHKFRKA